MPHQKEAPAIPLFGKGMVVAMSAVLCSATIGMGISLPVLFVDWQEAFNSSRPATAAVLSTFWGLIFTLSVVPGYLMNRFGPRCVFMIGAALSTAGMGASYFAQTIEHLIVTIGVAGGIGFCFLHLPIIPCVTSAVTSYKSSVISLCLMSAALFAIGNRYVLRCIADEYSWRTSLVYLAGLMCNCFVAGMIVTSTTRRHENMETHAQYTMVISPSEDIPQEMKSRETQILENVEFNKNQNSDELEINFTDNDNSEKEKMIVRQNSKQFEHNEFENSKNSKTNTLAKMTTTSEMDSFNNLEKVESCISEVGEKKETKFRFLKDVTFLLHCLALSVNLSTIDSMVFLLTDFARSLDFDQSEGMLFLTITTISSVVGKMSTAIIDKIPRLKSMDFELIFMGVTALSILTLGQSTSFLQIVIVLNFVGMCLGVMSTIFLKTLLDLESVTSESYPIALGLTLTCDGVLSLIFPIIIGWSVDGTGSYQIILSILGCVCGLTGLLLAGIHCYNRKKHRTTMRVSETG